MNIVATPTIRPLTALTLFTPSGDVFTVQASDATWMTDEKGIQHCHLTIQASPEQYQHITTNHLFHLKPTLLSPTFAEDFQSDVPVEITVTLQPQLLSSLAQHATTPDNLINYLDQISQTSADKAPKPESHTESDAATPVEKANRITDPLLQTNSWFALDIKQPSGDISYRTFWSYLPPSGLAKEVTSNGQISAAMGHLFQDLATAEDAATEAALSAALDELFQGLGTWFDDQLSSTEDAFANLANELTEAFETWLTPDTTSDPSPRPSKQPIYRAMLTFFSDDDWAFTKLKGESTLQLGFQDEHAQWTCYAIARDKESQFLFYSVYPTTVSEQQRPTIAEYLTRANHGLIQGNFEFDFDNGEIRYKTSLDTTHLSINPKAIQQLVYTNVTIMGHYLPGIFDILDKGINATEAIQQLGNDT